MTATAEFPFADVELARRLERAEAESNASFVDARARLSPASGACRIEVAGAYAMFDGVTSPATQTFGLGMFQATTAADLDRLEAFFHDRGAPPYHEVSPLADAGTIALLAARGYHPFEFTSMLYQPIVPLRIEDCGLRIEDSSSHPAGRNPQSSIRNPQSALHNPQSALHNPQSALRNPQSALRNPQSIRNPQSSIRTVAVREVGADEADLYARTAAEGWREAGYADFMLDIGRVSAHTEGLHMFIAEFDGAAIAAGAMHLRGGIAHLAGACTVPEGRRRGAQLALLDYRLQYAAAHGCDIALMGAAPGSGSQRNAERNGFRIAYTRLKWKR